MKQLNCILKTLHYNMVLEHLKSKNYITSLDNRFEQVTSKNVSEFKFLIFWKHSEEKNAKFRKKSLV